MHPLHSLGGRRRCLRVLLLACIPYVALAAVPQAARATTAATGTLDISIQASSNLHDFDGSLPRLPLALERTEGGRLSGVVDVAVDSIDTGIERRNANMREMLDALHFPRIEGRFQTLDAAEVEQSGLLHFMLRIRDVERPMTVRVSHWQRDGGHVSFDASFDLSLRDFQLEAPSVLFLQVADRVGVTVHASLDETVSAAAR